MSYLNSCDVIDQATVNRLGQEPCLVVMGSIMGSNPGAMYWIDMTYCLFEKTKNKQKEVGVGPLKKNFQSLALSPKRIKNFPNRFKIS